MQKTSLPLCSELAKAINDKWDELGAVKRRFIYARCGTEKQHYLTAVIALEKEHMELWTQLVDGECTGSSGEQETNQTPPEELPF